jgi:tRNA threonylcarbamoyladenosine biosynthesis protein TsaB
VGPRFVLGIDTAARLGSIALAQDGSALAWETLQPGEHSSGLSRAGMSLLQSRGLAWSDLAGIAVSSGPGSFTGLRIGLAWAKGICLGSGVRLALVSEHEASALAHRGESALIATVLQGEKGEAQAALWEDGRCTWGPHSVPESDLPSALLEAGHGAPIAVAASGLRVQGFHALDAPLRPLAAAVAELGDAKLLSGESADLERSAPAYGRSPNARKPEAP